MLLFAAAVAAAAILIVQNYDSTVAVHWLGRIWQVDQYWLVVSGIVIAVVGVLGLVMIRAGARRYRRLRREHRTLIRDHEGLTDTTEYAAVDGSPSTVPTDWG